MRLKETNKKLESYGLQPILDSDLRISNYLMETFNFFQHIESQKESAMQMYKSSKFNVKSLAEALNIERQTIYNHPVLQQFIKSLQQELSKKDVFNMVKMQAEKIDKVEAEFALFYRRDIEIEELKIEVDLLKEQLLAKEIEYNNLEMENHLLKEDEKGSKIVSMAKYLEDE